MSKIGRAIAQAKQHSNSRSTDARKTLQRGKASGGSRTASKSSESVFSSEGTLEEVSAFGEAGVEPFQGSPSGAVEELVEETELRQTTLRKKETTGQFVLQREATNPNLVLQRSVSAEVEASSQTELTSAGRVDSSSSLEAVGTARRVGRSRFAEGLLERRSKKQEELRTDAISGLPSSNPFVDDLPRVRLVKDKS